MTTLLQRIAAEKAAAAEHLRLAVRGELRTALREMLPGQEVMLFGSITREGRFNEYSDVDIALFEEPPTMSMYQLIARLAETLGRHVDVLLMSESRFREKIVREGEKWTL